MGNSELTLWGDSAAVADSSSMEAGNWSSTLVDSPSSSTLKEYCDRVASVDWLGIDETVEVEARESSQRAQLSVIVVPGTAVDVTEGIVFSCMRRGEVMDDSKLEVSALFSLYKVELVGSEGLRYGPGSWHIRGRE
jgi:hypothetical protein